MSSFPSHGWTDGSIRMGTSVVLTDGGFIRSFRDSRYGIFYDSKVTAGSAGVLPTSIMFLYKIVDDTTSPTGYTCQIVDTSAISGWANFQFAAGTWFDLTLPIANGGITDSVIVVQENPTISQGPSSIRLIVRSGDSLSITSSLYTQAAGTGTPHFVFDPGSASFAWGFAPDASSATLEGFHLNGTSLELASSGTFSSSTPPYNGASAQYSDIVHYDGAGHFLIGRNGNGAGWAAPFTPGGGITGSPTPVSLGSLTANAPGPTGIENTGNYLWQGTSGGGVNVPSEFDGSAWTVGAQDLSQFPFAKGLSGDTGGMAMPVRGDFLTIGSPGSGKSVQWATTSMSGGVLTLTGQGSTGISTSTTTHTAFTIQSAARHTDNLTAMLLNTATGNTTELYAFAH